MQDYASFVKEVESLGRVSIRDAQEQTSKLLKSNVIDDDWRIDARLQAYAILDLVCKYKQNGDADDFHNYAITFSRINDYDAACAILECGLKRFPKNVDLLADYLITAPDSSFDDRYEKCDNHYQTLKQINMSLWTWRGFDFSIQYLINKLDQSLENVTTICQELNEISSKYLELFALDERSYFTTYLMQQRLNQIEHPSSPEKNLENAIVLSINAPRCSLKLAEIMFDKKEYDKALQLLDKTIYDSIERSGGVSLANVYLLRFAIKASRIIAAIDLSGKIDVDDELISKIKNAYLDYRIAKKLGNDSPKINYVQQYVKIIETATGVFMDEDIY